MKYVTKRIVLGLFAAVLLAGGVSVSAVAGDQDFTLKNRTGYTIDQVYVSGSKDNNWGSDILGRGQLKEGSDKEIKFSRSESTCVWDVKVVFTDDESAVWEGLDLCKVEELTIRYEGKKPTATWK